MVQTALDAASAGRITIAVAHRVSTVQKADRISVFDERDIVEQGTYDELMSFGGNYYELARLQNLEHL